MNKSADGIVVKKLL